MSPSAAFSLKEMPRSIYSISDYSNDSDEFVFPSSNFLRLDTARINVNDFTKKVLPCHMMFSVAKPEIRLRQQNTCYEVEFLPHRYFHTPEGFNGVWSHEELQTFKEESKTTLSSKGCYAQRRRYR